MNFAHNYFLKTSPRAAMLGVLILASRILLASSCAPPAQPPPPAKTVTGPDGRTILDIGPLLGGNARVDGMIPSGTGGPPIRGAQDLRCSEFDSSCRWHNEVGYNGHPDVDEFEFIRGEGSPDPVRGQIIFGTSQMPAGKWAVAGSAAKADRDMSALFVSDVVPCQIDDGELRFNYWTSPRSRIRICTRRPNDGKRYGYCSPLISQGDPGPAVVTIPGPLYEPFEIVLVVSGFDYEAGSQGGGGVVIDDLDYNARLCENQRLPVTTPYYAWSQWTEPPQNNWQNWSPESWSPVPPGPGPGPGPGLRGRDIDACQAIKCTFRLGESCSARITTSGWEVQQGPRGNWHTGIRQPYRPGDPYAIASGPAQAKSFRTAPFTLNNPRNVKFCIYRASVQAALAVNALTNGVPRPVYNSPPIGARPHEWLCEQRPLNPGSYDGLEFVAQNLRNEYAFLALDEIELIDQTGPIC